MSAGVRKTDRDDRGESLVELLTSIAILGIAVVAILGAVAMSSTASALHRDQAQTQNVLRNWAETISATTYTRCATPATFASTKPDLTAPEYNGYTADVVEVQHWRRTGSSPDTYDFVPLGPCSVAEDLGLARVTLQLTVTDATADAYRPTLDVVVRNACTSTGDPGCS